MDMSLNDMTGEQVIEKVRASGCIVPIPAVTSFPSHRYAGRVAAAGTQGIVAKLGAHNRSQAVALWLAPHGSR